ncbi:iron uptake transporter deferrochelatase/peroxidase subunit [Schaalia sp. lx-260]|uniref:iron uptake transporter deferrochelatase/peroxidase subunit n=1 Tax=Schaalia sp. lx-260 TaxID=2899082 RepID=UPI001E3C287A|nr:iron uptake transporter deferrochelatase/peroxidase subunit [Schaalia sp. lx-260]
MKEHQNASQGTPRDQENPAGFPPATGKTEASHETAEKPHGLSRRQFLGLAGLGALTFGLGGASGFALGRQAGDNIASDVLQTSYPFRGKHQQGILTPAQQQMHTAAFDLTTDSRDTLIELLRDWTLAAERMTQGEPVANHATNLEAAPRDTGETIGAGPAALTISFGVGRSLFLTDEGVDRFGLAGKLPQVLEQGIPRMAAEKLDPQRGGGDLIIQACSEDPMVNLHALHNLTRIAFGRATMRWTQLGYGRTSSTSSTQRTPRNLFGFKDGTSNIKAEDSPGELNTHLWIQPEDDQGSWAAGGTYMCTRKIKMMMEVWDELSLGEQQRIVGRDKFHGAPLSGGEEFSAPDFSAQANGKPVIDPTSHVALMHPTNNSGKRMLRRGYNYLEGVDYLGRLEAGLFFIAFVRDPAVNFIPVLSRMSDDLLTEYLQHIASGMYLILPGVGEGDTYVGETLLA